MNVRRVGVTNTPVPPKFDTSLQYNFLMALPTSTSGLNHLTIAKLRCILQYCSFAPVGSKDQLVLRVYLLRHGKITAIVAQERDQIKMLVRMCNKIAQRSLHITRHIYRCRKCTLQKKNPHILFHHHLVHTPHHTGRGCGRPRLPVSPLGGGSSLW